MKLKVSKRAFDALDGDTQQPADTRPAELDRLIHVSGDVLDTLKEIFAGTGLLDDQPRVEQVLEARREIEASWQRAARSFIEVGKSLLRLDQTLISPEERTALKTGCDRLFPFSDPIASQLRAVARAVDGGLLTADTCPASYSVAYQLTLIETGDFAEAKRRGLFSPSVTRAALIAFRKERQHAAKSDTRIDETRFRAEIGRIAVRIARLREEICLLEARRSELTKVLEAKSETVRD